MSPQFLFDAFFVEHIQLQYIYMMLRVFQKFGTQNKPAYMPILVVTEMHSAVIHPIGEYIRRCQANIAENVAYRLIYELYDEAERMLGTIKMVRFWDQGVENDI